MDMVNVVRENDNEWSVRRKNKSILMILVVVTTIDDDDADENWQWKDIQDVMVKRW